MRTPLKDRLIIALITTSLVVPPLPAFPQERQQAPALRSSTPLASTPSTLADGKFEGVRSDRNGNFLTAIAGPGDTELTLFHAPSGGTFSKRIELEVGEEVDQLQIVLTTAALARGRVRLRLVDPTGAAYVPRRLSGNRYDRLRDLDDEIRMSIAARRDPDLASVALDSAGFFFNARDLSDTIVHIKDPMPGRWSLKVTARNAEADFFLAAALVDVDRIGEIWAEGEEQCCVQGRSSICSGLLEVALSVLPLIAAGFATSGLAAGVATTVLVAVIIETIVRATGDLLVAIGWLEQKTWNKIKFAYTTLLLGIKITAVAGNPAAIFTGIVAAVRRVISTVAKGLCILLVDGYILIVPSSFDAGVVGKKYNGSVRVFSEKGFEVSIKKKKGEEWPPGLEFAGKTTSIDITGEPEKAGVFTFTFLVKAKRNSRTTDERTFILSVFEKKPLPADLIVEGFVAHVSEARAGDKVTLSYDLRNVGETESQPGYVLLTWATSRDSKSPGFIEYNEYSKPIQPGETAKKRFKATLKLPKFLPRNARIFVTAKVDATKTTDETGSGEKNNTAVTEFAIIGVPTYKVTSPRSKQKVDQGASTDIRWDDGAEQALREVKIQLFQRGRLKQTIVGAGSFVAPGYSWRVPKDSDLVGDDFRIIVESLADGSIWAQSARFSIVPAEVDLSGKWDVKFKLTIDGESGQATPTATIKHNLKRGTLTMDMGKDFGVWQFKAKNGVLTVTKAPFPDLCNDLLKCAQVTKNEGTYNDKRFHFDLDGIYTDEDFGDFVGQFDLDGKRR